MSTSPVTPTLSSLDFYLTTGYRGSGKDTLLRKINKQSLSTDLYDWVVLARNSTDTIDLKTPRTRVAYADCVKKDCTNMLNTYQLSEDDNSDLGKRVKIWNTNPDMEEFKKDLFCRQMLIDHAEAEKMKDPLVWVKKSLSSLDPNESNFFNTDFRFPEELDYFQSVGYNFKTIRVVAINPEVPIPKNVYSENNLDHISTDFVFVRTADVEAKDDIKRRLVEIFPQYADYVYIEVEW